MSNANIQDKLNAWIQLNHPAHFKTLASPERADLMAVASQDQGILAPSQAAITGAGAAAAKSNSDWASNPALGAVNCAQMARNAAGYNPMDLDSTAANSVKCQDFVNRIMSCPLYVAKYAEHQTINKTSSNWDDVINEIANTFEGIVDKDKNAVISSLKNLAQAASSKMSTTQTEALFVQNVINVDDVISYYLYSTKTTFQETKGKGYDTKASTYDLLKIRLEFQTALWPNYWQSVKNAFDGSFNDWLNQNSSSTKGTVPIPALT